jgi:biotin-dependent carboxylase-like uncharacterized protein
MIEVEHPGALTTVQDLGRPGHAHLGVPASGAADPGSLRLANRLVGNPEGAAALETTLIGPRLRMLAPTTVAITGAEVAATVDGRGVAMNAPLHLRPGEVLAVGTAVRGLRSYVAVRGGLALPATLGSRSTDVLTGLGPAPLLPGGRLAVDAPVAPLPGVDLAPVPGPAEEPWIGVFPGPHDELFGPNGLELLTAEPFEVLGDSNRIGVRLRGVPLAARGAIASQGMMPGAIQVPPDGSPVLLLVDHPTTGGYPVIAVVRAADLPACGQLRPGGRVRFWISDERMIR